MASAGFLAWLEKMRALTSGTAAGGGSETLTTNQGSALDVPIAVKVAASPSTSCKDERSPRLPRDLEEQKEAKPLAPPEATKTAVPPSNSVNERPEPCTSEKQPAKVLTSKKRPRSPTRTSTDVTTIAEPVAAPQALNRSPIKRRKLSDGVENKPAVGDAARARDLPRGLRERTNAAVSRPPTETKAKQKTPTAELRTPIPIPELLSLDAAVDWDLGEASMLFKEPTKGSSMLHNGKKESKKKRRSETDALDLKRPLNGSDFSFWRAVDRFYDLEEE